MQSRYSTRSFPLSRLKECIALMPLLVYIKEVRESLFSQKIDIMLTRLLKKNIEYVQKDFDEMFCNIIDFIS